LYFSAEAGWRINVPLRYRKDIPKIWDAVAKGIIDAVGSDHVVAWEPSGREDMYNENIWKLRTGFTSRVECLLPVMLSEGVNKGRITLEKVAEVCAENPAKIFGLYPKKGAIVVGADADFVVVDLDREVQVGKQHILTRSGWSLLEGHVMRGWPVMTILRGNVIAEWPEGEPGPRIVAESPVGRYVPRIPGRALYPLG
jgi:dihydropyrimidinase/dihydroorotase